MEELEKKWYVLRAIGGKEKKVKEYIENEVSRLNLQEYISQVLIPTEKVYQIRSGKKISKERNFFASFAPQASKYERAVSLCVNINDLISNCVSTDGDHGRFNRSRLPSLKAF